LLLLLSCCHRLLLQLLRLLLLLHSRCRKPLLQLLQLQLMFSCCCRLLLQLLLLPLRRKLYKSSARCLAMCEHPLTPL
jgi:hypothetical protein